ncbi:MAG TPA: hypothetical protein PLR83_01760 [Pyrinomonadaceae bacterium]|nr:hypothetical protein [Pyrinomonadaceae bacterium]
MLSVFYEKALPLVFALWLIASLPVSNFAQNKETFWHIETGYKAVDLTKVFERECTEVLVDGNGSDRVEVRFQPNLHVKANEVFRNLRSMLSRTRQMLRPLPVNGIRFYLMQSSDRPQSYGIRLSKNDDLLLLAVIVDPAHEDRNLSDIIYKTAPHEMVHSVVHRYLRDSGTRWFEDGLADYVGRQISDEFTSDEFSNERQISARATLHQSRVRQSILDWHQLRQSDLSKGKAFFQAQTQLYDASQALVGKIVADSERRGMKTPLSLLLSALRDQVAKTGKPVDRDGLLDLIRQHLQVDVKTLGRLDKETQQKMVESAYSMLTLPARNGDSENKFFGTNILANIDEVQLPENWLKYLLRTALDEKAGSYINSMAATALTRRERQIDLKRLIEKASLEDQKLGERTTSTILKELKRLSIDKWLK